MVINTAGSSVEFHSENLSLGRKNKLLLLSLSRIIEFLSTTLSLGRRNNLLLLSLSRIVRL